MKSAAILVLALLAGCVAPAATDLETTALPSPGAAFVPPAPDFDFTTVVDPNHGAHPVAALHDAGHGLTRTGFTPIQPSLPPGMRGSITQVDVWNGYAVVSGMEGGLGFAIVDINDPAAPTVVSHFPAAADGWTARFTDDGAYVFYGCQILGVLGAQGGGVVKGDCTDPNKVHPGIAQTGVVIVDVQDKAAPKFVTFVPTSRAHNLFVASIDGYDWAFTDGVDIVRFDRATGTGEVVEEVPGVHDASVARHPLTGAWLLFTGTENLAIYDISDPATPTPVFEGGLGVTGWHEQTMVPGVVDGRVLLVLAGESLVTHPDLGLDTVSFVDITDPAHPEVLSTWVPPFTGATPWVSYQFSVHEIAATPTGQVAIAWYHAGMWVLDVSTKERQAEPVTLAAYQPNEPINVVPSTFVQTPVPVVPFVWGAGWDARGYLVVPDMHTGLYVMEPEWGLVPGIDGGQ